MLSERELALLNAPADELDLLLGEALVADKFGAKDLVTRRSRQRRDAGSTPISRNSPRGLRGLTAENEDLRRRRRWSLLLLRASASICLRSSGSTRSYGFQPCGQVSWWGLPGTNSFHSAVPRLGRTPQATCGSR
jgi:hypothetical protein